MRDLCVKGDWVTFFPHLGVDCLEGAAHVGALLAVGAPPPLLRVFTRGRVVGVPATKVWSGPILIDMGEKLPDAIGLVSARTPPGADVRVWPCPSSEGGRVPPPRFPVPFPKPFAGECSQLPVKFVQKVLDGKRF